jgi:hypothetical protein
MVRHFRLVPIAMACAFLAWPHMAAAETPPSITTPDKVDTRIGTLELKDGAPGKATLDKVYELVGDPASV